MKMNFIKEFMIYNHIKLGEKFKIRDLKIDTYFFFFTTSDDDTIYFTSDDETVYFTGKSGAEIDINVILNGLLQGTYKIDFQPYSIDFPPEVGETYSWVHENGTIFNECRKCNNINDFLRFDMRNAFRTHEEAEINKDKILEKLRLKKEREEK